MNPGKSTSAELRYEVRLIDGPRQFTVLGVDYDLAYSDSMTALVRMVATVGMASGRYLIEETIVGVIGGRHRTDSGVEMIKLVRFLNAGGVIGLDEYLVT
jgi:hypothetical protein